MEDTDYGLMYAARREAGEENYYYRVRHFMFPFYTLVGGDLDASEFVYNCKAWVPMDDRNTLVLEAQFRPGKPWTEEERAQLMEVSNVRHVLARRGVDISNRRAPLLRKAGAGLSASGFRARARARRVGHAGLNQSAALVALGLGLDHDGIEEDLWPVIAEESWDGPVSIGRGQVAGYHQTARALKDGREVVRLELTYAVNTPDHDSILIDADPKIELEIRGGVSGDTATAWSVLNAAPRMMRAGSGLLTVMDLPPGLARRDSRVRRGN